MLEPWGGRGAGAVGDGGVYRVSSGVGVGVAVAPLGDTERGGGEEEAEAGAEEVERGAGAEGDAIVEWELGDCCG